MEENKKLARKHFSRLGWYFMFGTLVIYVVQLVPMYLVQAWKPQWLENGNISLLLSIVPMYVIALPFLIWLLKKLPAQTPGRQLQGEGQEALEGAEKRSGKGFWPMSVGQVAVSALMCYAIMYVCNLAGVTLTGIISMIKGSPVDNVMVQVTSTGNTVLIFLYTVICAPIFEEYIFRKLIVDSTVRYGEKTAVLLSALMFALFHGNLNQFVYAFGIGLFLGFLYVKTGQLKITIVLHMIINFMGGIVGVLFMKMLHLEEITLLSAAGDVAGAAQAVQDNMGAWIAFFLYVVLLISAVIAGIVLLIVYRKRFKLDAGKTQGDGEALLLGGKGFCTAALSPGMLAYSLFWLGMIVMQMLA